LLLVERRRFLAAPSGLLAGAGAGFDAGGCCGKLLAARFALAAAFSLTLAALGLLSRWARSFRRACSEAPMDVLPLQIPDRCCSCMVFVPFQPFDV